MGKSTADAHVVVEHEQIPPPVLHDLLTQVSDQGCHRHGLATWISSRQVELVLSLVREEHLQSAAAGLSGRGYCANTSETHENSTMTGIISLPATWPTPGLSAAASGMPAERG